jgi:hypothetical protein
MRATDERRRKALWRLTGALMVCVFAPEVTEAGQVRRFDLQLAGRRITKGPSTMRVTQGDRVEMQWTTDQPVRLHLHGFDVELAVTPNASAVMRVRADATGRFPIAAHGDSEGRDKSHRPIAYLEVHPR